MVELHVSKVLHVGPCDAAKYPIAKKKISLEFLREKIHLRTRTNTIAAIARIRSALSYATHTFFHENGFMYVHTPLITQSDCEGAGEMFQVTTLLGAADAAKDDAPAPTPEAIASKRADVSAAGEAVKAVKDAAKAEGGDKAAVKPAVDAMLKLKNELAEMETAARKIGGIFRDENGKIDYAHDFFSEPTFLTVSGQLNVETYACAMTSVYTFGPTFRAENSNTTRHLAEFWMIEPEIAFADLKDDMQCAEDYVRHCLNHVLKSNRADLEFLSKMYDKESLGRIENVAQNEFGRVTYTEAIDILTKAVEGRREVCVPGGVGHRPRHRARAVPRGAGVQETGDRVQLPQGHQGVLHAPERRRQNRRRDGRARARSRRAHRRLTARGAHRSDGAPHDGERAGPRGVRVVHGPAAVRLCRAQRVRVRVRAAHSFLHGDGQHPRRHPLPALAWKLHVSASGR